MNVLKPSLITISLITTFVPLSLFGIQIVAAQIAASATTSTKVIVNASVDVSEASTTPIVAVAATTTPAAQTATSTPSQVSPPVPVPTPKPPPPQDAVAREISNLEDQHMQKTGRYLQIIAGNQLPTYESGSVAGKLGKNIPDYVSIDVYESVNGKGYQIYFEENGTVYSYGYGPEATQRTYKLQIPVPASATSTPAVQ